MNAPSKYSNFFEGGGAWDGEIRLCRQTLFGSSSFFLVVLKKKMGGTEGGSIFLGNSFTFTLLYCSTE